MLQNGEYTDILLPSEVTEKLTTVARKKANAKYDATNTKGLYLKLNLHTDKDILKRLEEVSGQDGGKQGYIKALIRRDIEQRQ